MDAQIYSFRRRGNGVSRHSEMLTNRSQPPIPDDWRPGRKPKIAAILSWTLAIARLERDHRGLSAAIERDARGGAQGAAADMNIVIG